MQVPFRKLIELVQLYLFLRFMVLYLNFTCKDGHESFPVVLFFFSRGSVNIMFCNHQAEVETKSTREVIGNTIYDHVIITSYWLRVFGNPPVSKVRSKALNFQTGCEKVG